MEQVYEGHVARLVSTFLPSGPNRFYCFFLIIGLRASGCLQGGCQEDNGSLHGTGGA